MPADPALLPEPLDRSPRLVAAAQPEVAVLLSVFGDCPFLEEQLGSIAWQADVRWSLLWRDDTGQDGQAETLGRFAARHPGRVTESRARQGDRLDVGRSFMSLLADAPPGAGFYAFADQDDVWLPEKLARACRLLEAVPREQPGLVCTRLQYVDAALRSRGQSDLPGRPLGLGNALVQNVASGCTIVLNAAARRAVLGFPLPDQTLHDWWCYIVVAALGGQVIHDAAPSLLYRRHGSNASSPSFSLAGRAYRAARRGPRSFMRNLARQLDALAAQEARLTAENAARVRALRAARHQGALGRLRALRQARVYRQSVLEDVMLRVFFLLAPLEP